MFYSGVGGRITTMTALCLSPRRRRTRTPRLVNDDELKFNVVARYRGRRDRDDAKNNDAVLLVGHVDVVPASRSDGWTDHPFSPVVRGGRMYGRGAGNMKVGVPAMVHAIVACLTWDTCPAGGA